MMHFNNKVLLAAAILGGPISVCGQEPLSNSSVNQEPLANYQMSPVYAGVRLGWGMLRNACDQGVDHCQNDSLGGGIYLGYQLIDWLALEAGLTDYGKTSASYDSVSVNVSHYGAEISAKLSYQIASKWFLFGRVGTSYQNVHKLSDWAGENTSQNWHSLLTVGLDYKLYPNWSLRGEYQFINNIGGHETRQSDQYFASFGITYRFGSQKPRLNESESIIPTQKQVIKTPPLELESNVLFDFDSNELFFDLSLVELARKLTQNPNGKIRITGYTDNVGSEDYNKRLSEKRALSIAKYFKHMGIAKHRIIVEGKGATNPIADNQTKDGREQNRRAEIRFSTTEEHESKIVEERLK